jgi:cytochrome b subunit of formate dehydrogenase
VQENKISCRMPIAPLRGRIMRHLLADRIYHWTMAACVLSLMATAFLPIIGYKLS